MTLTSTTATYITTRTLDPAEPPTILGELRSLCAGTKPWEWVARALLVPVAIVLIWMVLNESQ